MTVDQMKRWIDNATYEELLRKWRFAPMGDPFFCGEVGRYYEEVMHRKRDEVGQKRHVEASKSLGFGPPNDDDPPSPVLPLPDFEAPEPDPPSYDGGGGDFGGGGSSGDW